MKNTSETSYSNLLLSSHEIISVLEKIVYKQNEKKVNLRYLLFRGILARIIYKLYLNTWNTKYPQNVTCVCKNIISRMSYYHRVISEKWIFMTLMFATT